MPLGLLPKLPKPVLGPVAPFKGPEAQKRSKSNYPLDGDSSLTERLYVFFGGGGFYTARVRARAHIKSRGGGGARLSEVEPVAVRVVEVVVGAEVWVAKVVEAV